MNTLILFFYTLFLTFVIPLCFPNTYLFYFAPFLVSLYYRHSRLTCVWISLLCGLVMDLFSVQTRMGIHSFNYCLTTWLLYPYQRHFFEDSIVKLPVMTFLFSEISTLVHIAQFMTFSHTFPFSWGWAAGDLLLMPMLDALYAGLLFTLPSFLLPKTRTRKTVLFTLKGLT